MSYFTSTKTHWQKSYLEAKTELLNVWMFQIFSIEVIKQPVDGHRLLADGLFGFLPTSLLLTITK